MEKEIKITPPEGYEIDKENSTFECIKFKPVSKRWRDRNNNTISGYYLKGDDVFPFDNYFFNSWNRRDVFATKKQAKSAFAMAQISQIMANDEIFGGPITDKEWKNNIWKYCIGKYGDEIHAVDMTSAYHFLAFHTSEQRDLFLKENEDLVKDYLMID